MPRLTTADAAVLDVAALRRAGVLPLADGAPSGRTHRVWSWASHSWWRAEVERATDGALQLAVRGLWPVRVAAQAFALEATRPTFGGRRWWVRCPCGRRAAKLYLAPVSPLRFRCRACHGLAYPTQRMRPAERLLARADRLRGRLGEGGFWPGAHPAGTHRPRGMRRRTYRRLLAELAQVEGAALECLLAAYARYGGESSKRGRRRGEPSVEAH